MLVAFPFCLNLAGWIPFWERASHSALPSVLSEKCFVTFYEFSFPPGVYVGTLNVTAPIPGPTFLTLAIIQYYG